jgi:DNA-binding CsgD family transcriptional regulator
MMASGKTISQIGDVLALSPKTVSTYRGRILVKLDMSTTADLIRYAVEHGLVD